LMLGNHRPIIRGNDYGIWRRVRLVPFTKTFSEQERDPHLLDTLKTEAPHILAWMVEGCVVWQRRGLADVPSVVASQTADYRQEQDVIGQWLGDCTKADRVLETDTSELYTNYRTWALESGLKPASKVSLGRRLSERGYTLRRSNGKRYWEGVALNANNHGGYSYAR
jgi:putative DNA primase/helicase